GRFETYLAKWHTLVPRQVDPATCRGGTLWLTFASLRPAQPHFVRSFAPEATHQPHRGGLTIAVASPKFIGNPPDGPGASGMLAGAHRRSLGTLAGSLRFSPGVQPAIRSSGSSSMSFRKSAAWLVRRMRPIQSPIALFLDSGR